MRFLALILRLIANWIDRPMAFSIPIGTDVSEVAGALKEFAQLGEVILQIWDSPQMIAARANVQKQDRKDQNERDIEQALTTGDTDAINKDLS